MMQEEKSKIYQNRLRNIQSENARCEQSSRIAMQMQFSGYTPVCDNISDCDIQNLSLIHI